MTHSAKQHPYRAFSQALTTKEDLDWVLDQIEIAKEYIYKRHAKGPLVKILTETEVAVEFINLLTLLKRAKEYASSDHDDQSNLLDQLAEYLTALPVIKLTLAYNPSGKSAANIKSYLRNLTATVPLLEITVDPTIIAGTVIEYQGRYLDLSYRQAVGEALKEVASSQLAAR